MVKSRRAMSSSRLPGRTSGLRDSRVVALGPRLHDLDDELPSADLRCGEALKDGRSCPAEPGCDPLQERHPVGPDDHHVDVLALTAEQPVTDESPDQEGLDPQLGGGEPDHLQQLEEIEPRSHRA